MLVRKIGTFSANKKHMLAGVSFWAPELERIFGDSPTGSLAQTAHCFQLCTLDGIHPLHEGDLVRVEELKNAGTPL